MCFSVLLLRGLHFSCLPPRTMRSFDSLSEKEILALAISQEEEDARIYADLAENLKTAYPATAEIFR